MSIEMAHPQSSKLPKRYQSIEGPTILNWNGSFTIFQTFKQMHKASKVPPFSTGMVPPQSSKHSNRCTRHQRSHHSQLEWLLHNLLNIQTNLIHMKTRSRRSDHSINSLPTFQHPY